MGVGGGQDQDLSPKVRIQLEEGIEAEAEGGEVTAETEKGIGAEEPTVEWKGEGTRGSPRFPGCWVPLV